MLITASRLVPAGANITRAPTPIIAASVLMPTASGGCGKARNKQLRTDLVDEAVWEEVCRLLEHPKRLEQEYRRRLVQEEKPPDELSGLEARMGRLRQGIARLIDSYAQGLIDKGEFEPRMARMRERLKQIEEQAQQVKDEANLERELTLILGRLDEFASRVKTGLHEADWLTRREIIRALVKRVEIDQEQVRVVFRVNPPPQAPQLPLEKDSQSLQHCRGVVSPILANVLLHELDGFMNAMKARFDHGKKRKNNRMYRRHCAKIERLRRKGDSLKGKEEGKQELQRIQDEIQQVDQLWKKLPSGDPCDGEYKRLYFCRYADDFCGGSIGSRADAEQIRQEVRQFIEQGLKLTIAEEKSHIRHSRKGVTFVGYELKTYSGDRVIKLKRGSRHTTMKSISEQIQLHIPQDKMQKFCAQKGYGIYATGKATHKPQWIHLTDAEIILAYNGELRGLANYYALAPSVKKTLHKLEWIWQTSLLKTLANKHKAGVNKIAKRLRTEDGLRLTVKREQETRYISVFRLKNLRKPAPHNSQLDVQPNGYIWTLSRSEVIKRLNRKRCEYCEATERPFEVHHVRKLKDVAKGKVLWQRMMAARHRKTLILCRACHHQLHAGTLPDKEDLKKHVKGEPCAVTSRMHGSEGG